MKRMPKTATFKWIEGRTWKEKGYWEGSFKSGSNLVIATGESMGDVAREIKLAMLRFRE